MPTYSNIKELTRGLQQGAKLLNDMFIKRKTVSVKYDDAVETLEGDENKLKHLINFGVVVRSCDTSNSMMPIRDFLKKCWTLMRT